MTLEIKPAVSRKTLWIGRIVSLLPVLLLLFAGTMKLIKPQGVVDGLVKAGYPEHLITPLGVTEILCTIVYLIPQTNVLGAILLTGFLGGATATEVRISDPSFFLPVVTGVLVWLGLFLREPRLRALIPLRR